MTTEATAPLSPVQIEKGLGSLLATQYLDASDGTERKDEVADGNAEGTETTDELAATDGETSEFLLDLKVNGKEHRITDRAEAIKYAQLGMHFTQRNEAVIQRERQAEEREAEAVRYRDQYAGFLPEIEAYLANPLGPAPTRDKFPDDLSYYKAKDAHAEALKGVEGLRAERQRVDREQQEQRNKAMERWVREQEQAILTAIPEWNDTAVMRAEGQAMTEYALRQGISQQALQNPLLARDKAFILILRDAMRFQQVQSKGATEVKRVQATTAAPGTKPAAGETVNRRRKELETRAKSGKTADIAPAMGHLLARTLELQQKPKQKQR